MTDNTSGTRTPPPPPPPPKRPPPPPPPPKKTVSVAPPVAPPQAASPAGNLSNKSRTPIIAGVAILLVAVAGTGAWFYMDYAKQAEEVRVAREKVKQEEDLKKQEADRAAALHEQVAASFRQSTIPFDRASPHIQLMLDGSAANNEPAIVSAQHEIEALPKPAKGDNVLAVKLANEAVELDRKKDSIGAIPLLLKAVAADQSDTGILLKLSEMLRKTGDLPDADTACRLALTLSPTDSAAWFSDAGTIAMQGKKEASVAAYLNYVRFSSNKKDARALLESMAKDENVIPAVRDATKAVLDSSALMLVESSVAPAAAKPEKAEAPPTPAPSANPTPTASPPQSYRIPGRIIRSVPAEGATQQKMYTVTVQDNTKQITHSFTSTYNYQPGTTLYMRVYEDGHIVIE